MSENKVGISYTEKIRFNSIYMEITSRCNACCPYCYNDSNKIGIDMPYSKIIEVMEQAHGINQNVSFTFSGGEPLMHPDIVEIIDFGCSMGTDIAVITNGCLLRKASMAENFYKCSLQVTLDTLDEGLHDSIRGTGSFSNIKNLQRYLPNKNNKPRVLRINLTKDNLMNIKGFTEFALDNDYTELSFGFPVEQGRAKGSENLLDFDNRADWEICLKVIHEIEEYTEKYKDRLKIDRKNCYPRIGCELTDRKKPTMALRITPDGYVYPCLYFCDTDNSLGNINNAAIYEILKGQSFLNLMNSILYRESHIESCKSCIWDKHCFKGCPALAYSKYGSFDHKISCSFMKGLFERIIREKRMSLIK